MQIVIKPLKDRRLVIKIDQFKNNKDEARRFFAYAIHRINDVADCAIQHMGTQNRTNPFLAQFYEGNIPFVPTVAQWFYFQVADLHLPNLVVVPESIVLAQNVVIKSISSYCDLKDWQPGRANQSVLLTPTTGPIYIYNHNINNGTVPYSISQAGVDANADNLLMANLFLEGTVEFSALSLTTEQVLENNLAGNLFVKQHSNCKVDQHKEK